MLGSGESISGDIQLSDMDVPMSNDSGVAHQSSSGMSDLGGDFDKKTGTPLSGSAESISENIQFSDMDVPMSNDSGDLCGKTGNGRKTGMQLYMPFVLVNNQLFGDFNSSAGNNLFLLLGVDPRGNQRELCVHWMFPWRIHYFGVRFPPRGRTLDYVINCLMS